MNLVDYRGLAALDAVVDYGSFDKAAVALAITQSAVSQRIRLLENDAGELLLVRTQPPRATEAGQRLIAHYRQVRLLEAALRHHPGQADERPEIAIAVNADSAATWLQEALAPLLLAGDCLLNIRLDDQDHTLSQLREGRVFGCVTSESARVAGTTATPLGAMRYLSVAAPACAQRWFAGGFTADAVRRAPALRFDRKDELIDQFLLRRFGQPVAYPHHSLSSSQGFVDFVAAGYAWGMLPTLQCAELLADGRVVDLAPGHWLDVPLTWYAWDIQTPLTRQLSERIVDTAQRWMKA